MYTQIMEAEKKRKNFVRFKPRYIYEILTKLNYLM